MNWIEALKKWNEKKGGKYVIPKKGTKQHAQVMKLMKGGAILKGDLKILKGATMPKDYKKTKTAKLEKRLLYGGNLENDEASGMIYKSGFNPRDFETWGSAEAWLKDNGATQKVMTEFYKRLVGELQEEYSPKEWRNMGMRSNVYDVEKLTKIPITPDSIEKDERGDNSWLQGKATDKKEQNAQNGVSKNLKKKCDKFKPLCEKCQALKEKGGSIKSKDEVVIIGNPQYTEKGERMKGGRMKKELQVIAGLPQVATVSGGSMKNYRLGSSDPKLYGLRMYGQ